MNQSSMMHLKNYLSSSSPCHIKYAGKHESWMDAAIFNACFNCDYYFLMQMKLFQHWDVCLFDHLVFSLLVYLIN